MVFVGLISTHAPTWGATRLTRKELNRRLFQLRRPHGVQRPYSWISPWRWTISIQAPTWGATEHQNLTIKNYVFQLRRPHGAQPLSSHIRHTVVTISTHAPKWGATYQLSNIILCALNFNSGAHMGRNLDAPKEHHQFFTISTQVPTCGATVGSN